jgi:cation diffusion facilitator family transporter
MLKLEEKTLIKSASYASVSIALMIMIVKAYGWFLTGSHSMFASLIDSMLDISSSLINLIAIKIALSPPDNNHRFGHEKFQDLAIFSQAIFFFASCLLILFSSFKGFFEASEIQHSQVGTNIMYFCMLLSIILIIYQSYVVKKTKSKIIEADKLHYISDFLTTFAVIVSLNVGPNFWYFDPLAGIVISFYIVHYSYQLFKQAIKNLADEEFPEEDKKKIIAVVKKAIKKESNIKGLHELKTRYAASKPFIQFHLELKREISLLGAHEIAEMITNDLLVMFPFAEIIIHQDPEGIDEKVNYREKI